MKKKPNPLKNIQLIAAIVFLFLVALGFKVVIPKASDTLVTYNKLDTLKNRLNTLNSKISDLNGLNNYELDSRNNDVNKALPPEKNNIDRMSLISLIADQNGILIENMRMSPGSLSASGSAALGIIGIDLSLAGGTDQIISFLTALRSYLPLSNIKSLSINLVGGGATLKLETYFMGYPKTIGKIDSSVPKLTDQEEKLLGTLRNYLAFQPVEPVEGLGGKENPFLPD